MLAVTIPVVDHVPTHYARSGDVNIAYQVTGDGPFDLVLLHGFLSHLDLDWEHPASRHVNERLASFARLIRLDKRGTGLSDRSVGMPENSVGPMLSRARAKLRRRAGVDGATT